MESKVTRTTEGFFVDSGAEQMIQYFEQGAELPPNAERVAVLNDSSRSGHVVRVFSSAENDLRLVAERPEAFDIVVPQFEGQEFDGVVAVIEDDDGYPLAFVTTQRSEVLGIVVETDQGLAVLEQEEGSAMPIDVFHLDTVIGIVTPNARGGVNALMDEVIPQEVQGLLEMYRSVDEEWVPGQN